MSSLDKKVVSHDLVAPFFTVSFTLLFFFSRALSKLSHNPSQISTALACIIHISYSGLHILAIVEKAVPWQIVSAQH